MSNYSCLALLSIRSIHFWGELLRQMNLWTLGVLKRLYSELNIFRQRTCSMSFILPQRCSSLAKISRSAIIDLYEKNTRLGSFSASMSSNSFFSSLILERIAFIWNVNAHLSGFLQYSSSKLNLSEIFCHSATGSGMTCISGTCFFNKFRKVDFPLPIFPQTEQMARMR